MTNTEHYQEVLKRVLKARDAGTATDMQDALYECVDVLESLIREGGGIIPGNECAYCGRDELECSLNPCAGVMADRLR